MISELKIAETLKELGIPASIKGYFYLKYAIQITLQDISLIHQITKRLYPTIAKQFDTTSTRVERAVRHAIEVGWNRGNTELKTKVFGYTIDFDKGKPTNGEFIGNVVEWLKVQATEKGGAE